MGNRGASPLRILLTIAAVMIALVFIFMGQLYFGLFVLVAAIGLGIAMLFSRAKTPSD
jgi:hypothetical protein